MFRERVTYVRPSAEFERLSCRSRNGNRAAVVRSLIQSTSLEAYCNVVEVRKAARAEALLAHSHHYLRVLCKLSRLAGYENHDDSDTDESSCEDDSDFDESIDDDPDQREEAGLVDDCFVFPGVWDLAMLTVGGTIAAAESLVSGVLLLYVNNRDSILKSSIYLKLTVKAYLTFPAFLHVNDIVVACKVLLSSAKFQKLLYIDVDIHHGDGVENAFLYTNSVVTLSLHLQEPGFYPGTGKDVFPALGSSKKSAVCVPLRHGIADDTYIKVFTLAVNAIYAYHRPDAIILQCGVDGACGDPLGGFNLTGKAYTRCVEHILAYRKPTLILGGGGYHSANAARIWSDVLERSIFSMSSHQDTKPAVTVTSRDIPIQEEYFNEYGPLFSRDLKPLHMKDANTDEHISNIINTIEVELKAIEPYCL